LLIFIKIPFQAEIIVTINHPLKSSVWSSHFWEIQTTV